MKNKISSATFPDALSPAFIYLLQDNALDGKVAKTCLYKMLKTFFKKCYAKL